MGKTTLKESAASFAIKQALNYARKDPDKNLIKVLNLVEKTDRRGVNRVTYAGLHKALVDPNNNWTRFFKNMLTNVDSDVLSKFVPVVLNIAMHSYDLRTAAIEKYKCNIPWAILIDPTAACNLKCKGCWAAEYGKNSTLGYDNLASVIRQGKELGTFTYIFSGGEPLVCKDTLIRLCDENPDCAFLAFTNGTLVDDKFADELKRVGNFALAFSIEGYEDATDMRRGEGTYQKVIDAMALLKKRGVIFGYSACYHSKNVEEVCSSEYIDFLIDKGCMFAWYFTYMPVGKDAVPELMVSAEQRKRSYDLIRDARSKKPIFLMDFWNDGEYVQGCIAGGRHYLHINANGDVEPCAFVHYSNVNIKDVSLIEALQSPLFMEYYKGQPWNENHLRPCPVLDNPDAIVGAVERSGAHSTEMLSPENVNDLAAKTRKASENWAKVADAVWADTDIEKHNNPTIMYQDK
ncbi:MAG: radical SAM protein [Clostridiales bacterium]|nr:radical SAM protein [Clostridiales bacterium]